MEDVVQLLEKHAKRCAKDIPPSEVDWARSQLGNVVSLDGLVGSIPDPGVDVEGEAVLSIEAARVRRLVCGLPALERRVIRWRFGLSCEPMSCAQVAERLGVSKATAWRIEQRGLVLLRGGYPGAQAA